MTWNERQVNSPLYKEGDLQEAYEAYLDKYNWYSIRLERRMRLFEHDLVDVQASWDRYLRLRNRYGHGPVDRGPVDLVQLFPHLKA